MKGGEILKITEKLNSHNVLVSSIQYIKNLIIKTIFILN